MHHAPDMTRWQGRIDAEEGDLGKRWHQIVQPCDAARASGATALLGFASDAGIARNHGRTGAHSGPSALRTMLANIPVRHTRALLDAGDVVCEADQLEGAQAELSEHIAALLDAGAFPVAMGGGHEIAWGSFGGLARHLAAREQVPRIGIVNLDAHFDLRLGAHASSGTPFRQIAEDCEARGWPFRYCCLGISEFANTEALFERARRLGVRWMRDDEMEPSNLPQIRALLNDFLDGVDHLYFTLCLDVLPAAIAPGVSAPAPRGVPLAVVEPLIDLIAASRKLRVADIAELNPERDIDAHTARVAARLLARLIERRTATEAAHA